MPLVLKNNAVSTLAGGITAVATTISVQTADANKFPVMTVGDWHPVTVVDGAGNIEIMRVTGRSGAVLTVVRGQEGTTPFAFLAGASVQLRMTAASILEVLNDKIGADGPTLLNKVLIDGITPYIQFRDTDNAGAGKHYFLKLNGDVFSITRDMNADGDDVDANEIAMIPLKFDGASGLATTNFDFKANSIQWVKNTVKDNTNLNDLVASGFYIGANFTNSPDGAGKFYVMVQRGDSDSYVQQTAWAHGTHSPPRAFTRTRNGGTWGAWASIAHVVGASGAGAGKVKFPAFEDDGTPTSLVMDKATGAALINTATVPAARGVLGMGTTDAPAFARVHAGGDATGYNFNSATNECAYMNPNTVRSSANGSAALQLQRSGSNGVIANFFRGTTSVGDISVTGSATSYNTSSDYRLKQDVQSLVTFTLDEEAFDFLPDTLRKLMALRPVSYRWAAEGPDGDVVLGYIAHELEAVFPNAVNGAKDAVEEIGSADLGAAGEIHGVTRAEAEDADAASWSPTGTRPVYQSVDHSKLVPALTAAMQELVVLALSQRDEIADLHRRLRNLGG